VHANGVRPRQHVTAPRIGAVGRKVESESEGRKVEIAAISRRANSAEALVVNTPVWIKSRKARSTSGRLCPRSMQVVVVAMARDDGFSRCQRQLSTTLQ
jgi:hypothetical protein